MSVCYDIRFLIIPPLAILGKTTTIRILVPLLINISFLGISILFKKGSRKNLFVITTSFYYFSAYACATNAGLYSYVSVLVGGVSFSLMFFKGIMILFKNLKDYFVRCCNRDERVAPEDES
jgi:hypothetical protein